MASPSYGAAGFYNTQLHGNVPHPHRNPLRSYKTQSVPSMQQWRPPRARVTHAQAARTSAQAQLPPPPRPTKEWSTWSSAKSHEMAAAVSAANEAHMARENSALVRLIEKLRNRIKSLEQEHVGLKKSKNDAEMKAQLTEAKLHTAEAKLERMQQTPEERNNPPNTHAAPQMAMDPTPRYRKKIFPTAPPKRVHGGRAPAGWKPPVTPVYRSSQDEPAPATSIQSEPPPAAAASSAPQPRQEELPPAYIRPKVKHTASWTPYVRPSTSRSSSSSPFIAARFEPEAALASRDCNTDCVSGVAATIDSVVDCVRCSSWQWMMPPWRTALSSGLVAAQQADLRRRAGSAADLSGDGASLWLEFGAWSGKSARIIRDAAFAINKTTIYSFDSFEGLPEDWRQDPLHRRDVESAYLSKGSFSRHGQPPFHEGGVQWEIGWFNATLGPFLSKHPTAPIGMLHIDCDLYSSTAAVFERVADRLAPDAVIVFDELLNYPEYRRHEIKALVELLQRTGRGYRVLGTGPKLILRHATSLNRMYTHIQRKEAHPFGGTSNEDVAIQLLPSTASSPAPVAMQPAVTPPAAIQPAVPAASGEHMLAPGINFF